MTSENDQLAPGFLVAPPSLEDPNFANSVILLAHAEETGAMGFVVNRSSDLSLHRLLKELEIDVSIEDRSVMIGGPVSGFSGFVLYEHSAGKPLAPGLVITDSVSISPSRDVLEMAAQGKMPGKFELLLGYAGWAPDQLEAELGRGGWLHSEFDLELIFDVPLEDRWEEAYKRLGVTPFGFMNVPGGAQA